MDTTIFLGLILGACLGYGSACSCGIYPPEAGPQRFCNYDIIFRGTALTEFEEREDPVDHSDPFDEFYPYKDWVYSVRVDDAIVMPGNMSKLTTIEMRTPTMDSMCGIRFPLDVAFLFFASIDHEGTVHTGLCHPNTPWSELDSWQQELMTDHIADFCATEDNKPPTPVTPPKP